MRFLAEHESCRVPIGIPPAVALKVARQTAHPVTSRYCQLLDEKTQVPHPDSTSSASGGNLLLLSRVGSPPIMLLSYL
jgi:hypothetical protein